MTTTGAPPRAEAAPASVETPSTRRRWGWWERTPLRARLVAIIVLLLAVGLGIAALATRMVVSGYLVSQVDDQLARSGVRVAAETLFSPGAGCNRVPTEYVVMVRSQDGAVRTCAWDLDSFGAPVLPDQTVEQIAARGGRPFTVGSSGGRYPAPWRMVAYPTSAGGAVYVALPLGGIEKTMQFLTRSLVASGVGIVLLGGIAAWLLVQRSLRPLRRIESTAAAIAAGDLSQRIPERPPSTEVGSLAGSLNAMLAHIERAFSAQEQSEARMRRFVSDASHELRTPLATIKGYGELYRMGALDSPDKVDDTMVRIEDSAQRMGTLVNDLLVLARLDEGRPLRQEPVDLVPLARDAAQDLHALDPGRTVTVTGLREGEPPPSDLTVTGDPDRLRQVLTNLVGNVARHTPAGTPAELALARTPDGGALLEVRDHGPGVDPEQAGRIFERFYRADSSRNRESGGSGLGLAIVAAIVGSHGGHVDVAPTGGGGLTVRVLLPAGRGYDSAASHSG